MAERLEQVYEAAAVATDQLSHLNIVKYEPTTAEQADGADLSLWETMAPALRDTLMGVNHLIAVIREQFPAPERQAGADSGWRPPPASADERLSQEVEVVFHKSADQLARRVAELGERVRRPEVVTDRWELMTELQSSRLDFRSRIGDMVYLTAAAFEDVSREEAVPGYRVQTAAAAALRAALMDLRRSLQGKLEKVAQTAPERLPALARQVAESLSSFVTMPASFTMRMKDKRGLLEVREQLQQVAGSGSVAANELTSSGAVVPRGAGAHHRAAHHAGADGARPRGMERVQRAARADHPAPAPGHHRRRAGPSAGAGASRAQLYGRSAPFDAFVRKSRRAASEGLEDKALRELLEQFREQLAALPFH